VPPHTLLIVTCSRRTTTQQFHRENTGLEDLSAWKHGVHLRITTLRTAQNPVQNIHSTLFSCDNIVGTEICTEKTGEISRIHCLELANLSIAPT
jgi:hypothetical protein